MATPSVSRLSIVLLRVGLFCIFASFLAVFLFPCPTKVQYIVLRIFISLFAAFTAGVIPGTLKYKSKIISATGGLAVLVIFYLLNPASLITTDSCDVPLDYTVFFKSQKGRPLGNISGKVKLLIGNEKKVTKIDDDGGADFKEIPFIFKDCVVNIEIDIKGWQFVNGTNFSTCKLQSNNAILFLQRDSSLCCLSGTVKDATGDYLANANVMVEGVHALTDQFGYFSIKIPEQKQKDEQKIVVTKDGFISFDDNVFPETKQSISVILKRR